MKLLQMDSISQFQVETGPSFQCYNKLKIISKQVMIYPAMIVIILSAFFIYHIDCHILNLTDLEPRYQGTVGHTPR